MVDKTPVELSGDRQPGKTKDKMNKIQYKPGLLNQLSNIGKSGMIAVIDQSVISLSNFIISILLARYLSAPQYGIYVVGFLLLHLVRAIQDGLIVQPFNLIGSIQTGEDYRCSFSRTGLFQLGLCLLISLTTILVGMILKFAGESFTGNLVLVLWFSFLFWQIQEFLRKSFYISRQVSKSLLISIISNVVRFAAVLFLIKQERITGKTGLDAIGWGSIAASVFGLWLARKNFSRITGNIKAFWKQTWSTGKWILGASIADWLVLHVYPIIAAGMINIAAAGAYQALLNLVAPVHVLLRAVDTYGTPQARRIFATESWEGLRHFLSSVYLLAGIPALILFLVVLIFPRELLQLISKDTYLQFSNGIFIVILFYILLFLHWPLQITLKAMRKVRVILLANLLAILSMFTVGIALVKLWGLYGAIAGQALNAGIIFSILIFSVQREKRAVFLNAP